MPSPIRSSVSVKTESAYDDKTADEVEDDENGLGSEDASEDEAEAEAATANSEAEDIVFVASDLVLPAVSAAELEARQSTESSTPRDANANANANANAIRSPRCEVCKAQKQKCTFENSSGKCDKCYRRGYVCHIVDSVNSRLGRRYKSSTAPAKSKSKSGSKASFPSSKRPIIEGGPRGARHVLKCDWCRKNNRTCLPKKRVWPRKCGHCELNGLACSPMAYGKRAIVADASSNDKGPVAAAAQSSENKGPVEVYTSGVLAPEFSEGSDGESDESDDSDASIPAVLSPVRKRKRQDDSVVDGDDDGDGGGPWSGGGGSNPEREAAGLREAISRMEDEYQEVLRSIQSQHKQELDAMRTKYELATEELAIVTRNHERRLDDLIYIMKNNERRADEIIQSLKNK